MSPTVGNFVHDLVEMAKAMEDLPKAQEELAQARTDNDRLAHDVQSREERIIALKAEIDSLNESRRKLEAERDDAEYRFLELDDKFRGLAGLVASAGKAVGLVDKPEPVKEPEPKVEPVQGQSAEVPTAMSETIQSQGVHSTNVEGSTSASPEASASANPDPTASSTAGDGHSSETAPSAEAMPDASTQEHPPQQDDPNLPTQDDVGYHNEPERYTNSWYDWANRMDRRYNHSWPTRPNVSQAAS